MVTKVLYNVTKSYARVKFSDDKLEAYLLCPYCSKKVRQCNFRLMKGGDLVKIRLKDLDKFNETLIRKGYTKAAYSEEIGLSRAAGSRLCAGKTPYFSPAIAAKTVEKLNVEFDELFVIVKDLSEKGAEVVEK